MSTIHYKYVLVGGGLACSAAAQAIRQHDREGALLVVGQEINRPYHRPALSKAYLRGQNTRNDLFSLPADWFSTNHVELQTGQRVAHLDTARRSILLVNGSEIAFDKLLIATGGTPRHLKIPGADLPNVYYLRTLEDADRLRHAIDKAKSEGRPHARGAGHACVIGAGLLGVELSASLTQLGLETTLLAAPGHPWRRFAGEATGNFITHYLAKHGVQVHCGRRALRLEGDGRVQRVIIEHDDDIGSEHAIDCDLVVAAIGIQPNKEILRGTPITAEKAILTDAYCRTSDPDIYAAGDCAAVFDARFGKHRHIDHWDNAIQTGTIAGTNMAGAERAYDAVNTFSSEVFSLGLTAWGEAKQVDRRILRGSPNVESPDFIEFGVAADGRIAQILAIGHREEDETLKELVRRRLQVDGNENQLRDPSVDLASLL